MAKTDNMRKAKDVKNDEFYTQYSDIQSQINCYLDFNADVFKGKTILLPCDDPEWSNFTKFFAQNFERFGLKKLISTSYAYNSKNVDFDYQPSLFEEENEKYDASKTKEKGKIFILEKDVNKDTKINIDDLEWDYLEGDGDFRSKEVIQLRNEADIIITNPPFSLFREFISWIMEADKKFIVIGSMNAAIYKEIFPYIKNNQIWLGNSFNGGNAFFGLPKDTKTNYADGVLQDNGLVKFRNCCWFTNIDHGKRHQPLSLMTLDDNIKFSKHKEIKTIGYNHYDNFDGIDVPYTDSIPSDYDGVMGVPVSFLDRYCPEQFELLGIGTGDSAKLLGIRKNYRGRTDLAITVDGKPTCPFNRILIRRVK